MAAEAGPVLIILTAFVTSTISGSKFISLEPRNANMVAGTWREKKFTCTARPSSSGMNRHLSSANLTFVFTSRSTNLEHPIPDSCTRRINDTTLEMSYCPLVDEKRSSDQDWLSCDLKHNRDEYKEAYVTIKDQHPTPQILEIEVYNWDVLSFLVDTNENPARMFNMRYAAWFRNNSAISAAQRCRVEKINATVLKATVADPFRVSHPNDYLIIKVNGTANEIVEKISTDEIRLNLNQFVRPAKVSRIEVLHTDTSTIFLLEPPKLNRNITYNVVVKCDKDLNNHTVNVTREINCPPNNDTRQSKNNVGTHCRISKEFTDLPAFSSCTASVRAIPVAGGRWSDWKSHDFETPEGVPLRNPEICSNCFSIRQGISDSLSDVLVYFTPLSEEEAQGKIVLYKIRIFDKIFSNESFQYFNNTENNRYSLVLRNLSHHIDYEIGIEAKTSKGYYSGSSNISEAIEVSLSRVRSLSYPKDFVVILLNYTAVRASWSLDESACGTEMKISLFWCEGHFWRKTCTDVLKWKSISSAVTSDIITFSGGESIIGIGTECDGKSSGILWSTCIYDIDKNPPEPDIHRILLFDSGATIVLGNKSKCSSGGRRTGLTVAYRISYCQILHDVSNIDSNCVSSWTTLTLNLNRSAGNSLIVSGLNQNQKYRLSIQSLSENNKSSPEVSRTIGVFPMAKRNPDNSNNSSNSFTGISNSSGSFKSSVLIPAILATLAVLVTIAAVVYCRSYVKSEIPVTLSQPVVVKGAQSVSMHVESFTNLVIDPYAVLSVDLENSGNSVESGDSSQPEVQNLTFNPKDFISPKAEIISILPNRFSHIYPGTQEGTEPMLAIQATLQQTFQSGGRQSEADTSRILPSVFGRPSNNAAKTDIKVTVDEQQCQQKTLYEHQEPRTEAYSPPASDCVSDNDEYMSVAHGNPESSKLEKSSVREDSSGAGYIDGSARLVLAMQPPPAGPAQSLMDDGSDDDLVMSASSSPAMERSHRSIVISSEDNDDVIDDYIESLVGCQSASISISPDSNVMMITEGGLLKEYFLNSNKVIAMQISTDSSSSKCWPSMTNGGLDIIEDVDGKTSLLGTAWDGYCSGMRQDHANVCPELIETEELKLKPMFIPSEKEKYEFFADPSIPVRHRSDLIMEFEDDCRSTETSILPSILLT